MVPPSVTWTVSYAAAGSERRSRARKPVERVRANSIDRRPRPEMTGPKDERPALHRLLRRSAKWRTIRGRRTIRVLVLPGFRRQLPPFSSLGPAGPQPRPVDAPGAAHADPDQRAASLGRRRQRQMVEVVDAGVETAGVRRLQEAETFPIEVMTELVQQRVKEATIGRHLPEHGGAHPDPDPLLLEVVVTEQLEVSALPDLPRPGPQHPQSWRADRGGPSEQAKNRCALYPDAPCVTGGEGLFQKECAVLELTGVGESREPGERVAPLEFATRLGAPWRAVRDHAMNLTGLMRQHLGELANHVVRICAKRRSYDDTLTDA